MPDPRIDGSSQFPTFDNKYAEYQPNVAKECTLLNFEPKVGRRCQVRAQIFMSQNRAARDGEKENGANNAFWCKGHLDEHQEVPPVCIVIAREAFEAKVHLRGTIGESPPHNSLSNRW